MVGLVEVLREEGSKGGEHGSMRVSVGKEG